MMMKEQIMIYSMALCCLFLSCNKKITSYNEGSEVGFECYYSDYKPNTEYLNNYINKFSKFLFRKKTETLGENIEIFYGFHCYECPDEDKYAIFLNFNSVTKISYTKVNVKGDMICTDLVDAPDEFFIETKNVIGSYLKRDCSVEDGEDSVLVVRNKMTSEILAYYIGILQRRP